MDVEKFKALPLLGILRGIRAPEIAPLVETMVATGLRTVEITMNTQEAPALIRQMVRAAAGRLMVGAGTVLSMQNLCDALEAGATFAVMPVFIPDVTAYCVQHAIPVFPGALTPLEIFTAWQAGATMVKVFPSNLFGPSYFKEVRGPLERVSLMACGGITPDTIGAFFSNGADAASFGGSIFKREWLESGDFDRIGHALRSLISAFSRTHMGDVA